MPTRGERLRLLAGLLSSPEEDAMAALGELGGAFPWLGEARLELSSLPIDEWRAEHCRLFINGFPNTPCLPFQSAQLDGMMPGPSTADVNAFYLELGLVADAVIPDYLGTMLECAAYLAETETLPEMEGLLWHRHLLRWLPRYAEILQSESQLALYRGLGRELAGVCEDSQHV